MIVSIYIYRTGASQAWRIQLRNLETFFFSYDVIARIHRRPLLLRCSPFVPQIERKMLIISVMAMVVYFLQRLWVRVYSIEYTRSALNIAHLG